VGLNFAFARFRLTLKEPHPSFLRHRRRAGSVPLDPYPEKRIRVFREDLLKIIRHCGLDPQSLLYKHFL